MSSTDPGTSSAQTTSPVNTGKADSYIPVFTNQQRDYKEFKKRAEIYRVKMRLAGRQKETVFNLVTVMVGKAWDLVEDLPVSEMKKEEGFTKLFERLDKGFSYEPLTELPDDFEAYFIRLQRKSGQTLQEWSAEYLRTERKLKTTHGVDLPEKIRAWFYLRRSGISKEQRQLILTNVGAENLNLEAVGKAMNFILGQDSRMESRHEQRWSKKKEIAYYMDEAGDDDWASADPDETYYQDLEDDTPWLDADQAYYEEETEYDDQAEAFDVEEFDEIYAAYADAKNKLNRMRTSRGFYPVVALVDRHSSPSPSSPGSKGKGKGKKAGGKRPGKKGGKQLPVTKGGSKAGARGKAAMGRQVCLRCGQAGHWARDCPAAGGDKKRRLDAETGADEVMMVEDVDGGLACYGSVPVYALDHDDEDDNVTCNRAVQDGGAASVLGSIVYVKRYLRYLLENGFDLNTLEVYRCKKAFRYGNSATESTGVCVLLPVVMGGRKLKVLTYVIGGSCPLLFGRPILERLEVIIDYKNGTMRWPNGEWKTITRGGRGEHQLVLTENMDILLSDQDYAEILAPTDFETHVDTSRNLGYQEILGAQASSSYINHATEMDHNAKSDLMDHNADNDLMDHNAKSDLMDHNADNDLMDHNAKSDLMDHNTDNDLMDHNAKSDLMDHNAKSDLMDHNADNDLMDHNAKSDLMDHNADNDLMDHNAKSDLMDHNTDNDLMDHNAKSDLMDHNAKKNLMDHNAEKNPMDHNAEKNLMDHNAEKNPMDHNAEKNLMDHNAEMDYTGECSQSTVWGGHRSNHAGMEPKPRVVRVDPDQDCDEGARSNGNQFGTGSTKAGPYPPAHENVLEETVNAVTRARVSPEAMKQLPRGKLHNLIACAAKEKKELRATLDRAAHVTDGDTKVVREVFAGKGKLTASLKKAGAKVERFSSKEGWDFHRAKDRKRFLKRMHHEEPDEILITPPAKLWSPALEASLATDARGWARLCSHRQRDHDEILVFCALIYEVQRRGKRHAHLEHPWASRAWRTKALSRLPGHATYVDQCMYGLTSKDAAGRAYPVKKPTCYMTAKRSLCEQAGCKCQGEHQHGPEPPDDRHLSDDPTTQLADTLAELIVKDGPADYVLPVDEANQDVEMAAADDKDDQDKTEEIKVNEELKQQVGRQAYSYVARLHKNLGHPSPNVLARMLEEVQATENVITCAKHYLCAGCLKRKKPAGVPPASGLTAREFNERLMLDSAWIDTSDGRMCVLTIMCQATRFVTIRVLGSEQSKELLKGLERAWIKHFGVPKIIRIDEAKGWSATLIREWCSDHGVELEIAPAEAHSWLGAVERRHQVVRRSLELYMDDRQDRSKHGLREAAIFVPGQINLLSSVRGFSPAQWVLGKTPANSFSLTGEIFNPAAPDDDDDVGAFASNQKRRTAAQVAFLKADTDLRLRRAMNRNYRETDQDVPKVGQKVFFWRIQGAGILQKKPLARASPRRGD